MLMSLWGERVYKIEHAGNHHGKSFIPSRVGQLAHRAQGVFCTPGVAEIILRTIGRAALGNTPEG